MDKLWKGAAKMYRAEVGKRLASRGLMYEDVLVETADVKLALKRMPKNYDYCILRSAHRGGVRVPISGRACDASALDFIQGFQHTNERHLEMSCDHGRASHFPLNNCELRCEALGHDLRSVEFAVGIDGAWKSAVARQKPCRSLLGCIPLQRFAEGDAT